MPLTAEQIERRFQIAAGIFVYAHDFHSGQRSRLYRIMSRMQMKLTDSGWRAIRCAKCDPHGDYKIAREVYFKLKKRQAE